MYDYDLCIIGAGPSGYAAAMRALDYNKKVALIERNRIGGAGIFNGALWSKTLWELSSSYQTTKAKHLGYIVYDSTLNFSAVMNEANTAVYEKYTQLKQQIDYFQKTGQINFLQGHGKLISKHEVSISYGDMEDTICAENILLAPGSSPRYLPNIPIDEKIIMTSDGLTSLTDFPKSMVILGAGVIGSEFATIFSNFGKTKINLIDKQDRILPFEDRDLSDMVANNLRKNGVLIHQGASLDEMKIVDGMVEYSIKYEDGRKEIFTVEKALISVGRVANTKNLGLENVGVELNERGSAIDNDTVTTVDNIYAVGDFTADIALVNVGELEGRHAIERMYADSHEVVKYDNISTIMFLNPAIAGVGLNELTCRQRKIPYKVAKVDFKYINRAIAMRKTEGFFKILVTDDEEMKIIGMRALGKHASSTIEAIALLINLDLSIVQLADMIHPHPSITEGLQECARMLCGKSIIKPEVFNMDLNCYRVTSEGKIENLFEEHLLSNV